jgi:hypothetical protein
MTIDRRRTACVVPRLDNHRRTGDRCRAAAKAVGGEKGAHIFGVPRSPVQAKDRLDVLHALTMMSGCCLERRGSADPSDDQREAQKRPQRVQERTALRGTGWHTHRLAKQARC